MSLAMDTSKLDAMDTTASGIMTALGNAEKTILAGGFAGVVSKTITAPLSRITILYQVKAFSTQGSQSLIESCHRVYSNEGLASFWRGNLTSCMHRFPYSAINFTVYSALHGFVNDSLDVEEHPSTRLLCGAAAGTVACIVCYPLDLVRTRLTVQSSPTTKEYLTGSAE
jgi:solute carrier family 25 (mitochondrial phosphate transporter), member 23/24/25/41